MANRDDRLGAALHQERAAIAVAPATEGATGWGVGFYQNGEVLHRKRPQAPGGELDWGAVAGDLRSDCVILHVRQPTVGDFTTHDTHPFRLRRWLFAHTGTIDRFAAIRDAMAGSLPDFLMRNVRGKTDSELFFHVILSFLHDASQLDRTDVQPAAVVGALRSAVALVDRLGAEVQAEKAVLNLMLTNGRHLFALRRGEPLAWVERSGLHDPPPDFSPGRGGPQSLRFVMLASGAVGDAPQWSELPEGAILEVDRNLATTVHAA
ncbi:MAG: class II glutamine amidotransferase [Myxococcota bacterium]